MFIKIAYLSDHSTAPGLPASITLHPVNGFSELLVALVPSVCRALTFLTILKIKVVN